jgi:excisionase family DNA binding protein
VQTYTLREAAELCGVSLGSLRKRADRGQLQTVKRGGARRVPRSELERLGLRLGDELAAPVEVVRELTTRIAELERECATLRLLPERVELARREADAERRDREHAEREAAELRAWRERLAASGWRERRRRLRELRVA